MSEVSDELLTVERACIGALLQAPDLRALVPGLRPEHFANQRHAALLNVIDDLVSVPAAGETEVVAEILRRGCTTATGGAPYVHTCIEQCPLPANVAYYAAAVMDAARRRRVEQLGIRTVQASRSAQPVEDVLSLIDEELVAVRRTATIETAAPDLDAFLAEDDAPRDWLLPGLLERHDRLVLTAEEGVGKSTLLRQIAHGAAAGRHPFTGDPVPALTVLLIDVENSAAQIRRALRPLRALAQPEPKRLRIAVRTEGLDLRSPDDRAWLNSQVNAAKPDVLITGPLYKLLGGDPLKEEPAREATIVLDRLRADHDLALILEAHTPYAANGARNRPRRPYGASIWSRWPEVGLHLAKTGRLTHWRPSRGEYDWPAGLSRGTDWPFVIDPTADHDQSDTGNDLPPAARHVLEVLETETLEHLTVRQIGDRVAATGHPLKARTIQNAIDLLGDRVDSIELDNRGTGAHRLNREPTQ